MAAVALAVIALGIILPTRFFDLFAHDWEAHLDPIHLTTIMFLVGDVIVFRNLRSVDRVTNPGTQFGVKRPSL